MDPAVTLTQHYFLGSPGSELLILVVIFIVSTTCSGFKFFHHNSNRYPQLKFRYIGFLLDKFPLLTRIVAQSGKKWWQVKSGGEVDAAPSSKGD
jgi:hypothetical protein